MLLTPPLPSFLLLSTPTTDCWLRFLWRGIKTWRMPRLRMGGVGSNIYDEQGSAGGSAGISAAHPTPLDIPIRLIENRIQCDPPFDIHSNAITANASGPFEASTEHKVWCMHKRKKKFGRCVKCGGNRKQGSGGGNGSSFILMRQVAVRSNWSMLSSTSSMNVVTSSLYVSLAPSLQKTRLLKSKADQSLHNLMKLVSY